jgi:DNA-3-methyladenine glycosylase
VSPLPREVLARPVLEVAPGLLGAVLVHEVAGEGRVAVRVSEVEAYDGPGDPGSHAFRGPTPRTRVMFGPAGHAYVYLSYGMHWCLNVVTGAPGAASAVLVRAGEVVEGLDLARARRPRAPARDLARGPARLTAALGVGREHGGADLCAAGSALRLEPGEPSSGAVRSGPRVGVSGPGGDAERFPWRFWLDGDPTVSAYRPGAPRRGGRAG